MASATFDALFRALAQKQLSASEVGRLQEWLAGIHLPDACLALIESAAAGRGCPRCGCQRVHRCGHASGLQRFRCLGCRRSYNGLTGTPLARLRKREHWLAYLECVRESRTVRDAARRTGAHRTTSFRWRHRFVPGAARERPSQLGDMIEADETYLLESQKGSRRLDATGLLRPARRRGSVSGRRVINDEHDCLLVARDRTGNTLDFHTGRGPVTAQQLGACLRPVLPQESLLISDSAAAYRRFAADTGIRHEAVNLRAGIHVRGDIHLQNVNGWHARFKGWLVRFRGVASRYLAHYAGWQRLLDAHGLTTPAQWLLAAAQLGTWGKPAPN